MPTFGFSAYLKLLCLNSRPQRTEVRKRLQPSGSGYDFHRSLHVLSRRHVLGGESFLQLAPEFLKIVKEPERNSARVGIENLIDWRKKHAGLVFDVGGVTYDSPNGVYKVKYAPDFGVILNGRKTAIHIWNTKRPKLEDRFVYGSLSLVSKAYSGIEGGPEDVAVLSLRDNRIYCLSEVGDMTFFGVAVAAALEGLIQRESRDLGLVLPSISKVSIVPPPAR